MTTPDKNRVPPLNARRRLVHQFRKQIGITLDEFGENAGLSKEMLSHFERGRRDLSPEAWARVLEAMSKLVQGDGNLRWNPEKRLAGIVKAKETAAKLGVAVAQSMHSPTFKERLEKYAGIDADSYTKEELVDMFNDVLEIAHLAAQADAISRDKEQFWHARLDKADARIRTLKDLLGLREKQILTQESEQQKLSELGLEKLPEPEHDTLRQEIADHGKKSK